MKTFPKQRRGLSRYIFKYKEIYVTLTYTAPMSRLIAVHNGPVVDSAPSCVIEAATTPVSQVICANHIVEYDRAT